MTCVPATIVARSTAASVLIGSGEYLSLREVLLGRGAVRRLVETMVAVVPPLVPRDHPQDSSHGRTPIIPPADVGRPGSP